jgi:predicted nucleic acid-binding protein
MRVLIDTNIILDLFLSREPNITAAQKIFTLAAQEKIEACATASSVTDIYYVTAKRLGDRATREALRDLFNLVTIVNVDGSDCIQALDSLIPDFEDALVAVCANRIDVEYIVTNDNAFLKTGSGAAPVMSAERFLALIA